MVLTCFAAGCGGPVPEPGNIATHANGKIYYLVDGALIQHDKADGGPHFFLVEFHATTYEITESGIRVSTEKSRLEVQRGAPKYLPIITSPNSATRRLYDRSQLIKLTATFDETTDVKSIREALALVD